MFGVEVNGKKVGRFILNIFCQKFRLIFAKRSRPIDTNDGLEAPNKEVRRFNMIHLKSVFAYIIQKKIIFQTITLPDIS